MTTEEAKAGAARESADGGIGPARAIAIGALIAVAALVALMLIGAGGGYKVTAIFDDAGQLVVGNQVRVGGRAVGRIDAVRLHGRDRAAIEMTIDDDELTPLHRGTTATIRATSLSGIANRFVSLAPGPNNAPEIPDGGRIGVDDTAAPVDLDQLFNAFDPRTRRGLRQLIAGQAAYYGGRSRDAARALRYLAPALSTSSRLTRELVRDDAVLERFVTDGARAVRAIAGRRDALADLVANANTTAAAIGDENAALADALARLPGTLRKANTTFVNLRSTVDDLDPLVAASKPATAELAPFLGQLRPLVVDAAPTVRDLRLLIARPGPANDLIDLTARMPRLQRLAATVFPRAIRTMDRSTDEVDTLRNYTPDLAAWFTKFGQVAAAYDANGHYARIQPMFSPFSVNDVTGELTPVPPAERLDGFELNRYRRCPGGSVQPPPDGSAPLAVPDCDPGNVPPGG